MHADITQENNLTQTK